MKVLDEVRFIGTDTRGVLMFEIVESHDEPDQDDTQDDTQEKRSNA